MLGNSIVGVSVYLTMGTPKRIIIATLCVTTACVADAPFPDPSRSTISPTPSSTQTSDDGLPAEVARVKSGILLAAEQKSYEVLRDFLDPEVFLSDFGFGVDPVMPWSEMGDRPLRMMAALLAMEYEEEDTAEGHLFRWPVYDPDTKSLTEISRQDRRRFRNVLSERQFRRLIPNDEYGYVGPRLGILADGTWWFFIMKPGP